MHLMYLSITLVLVWLGEIHALNNGLALTPPMGWLSWERFGCQLDCNRFPDTCVSERLYLRQAQRLVQDGYLEAGYEYINIDDCWSAMDRENENWVENRTRFPHGIKHLSTTLHTWGLKLGLYADIGSQTCMGYPGLQGHFEQDAQTLADWGIDSVKVDACHANETLFNETYPAFGVALNQTGRPIMYSCSWPNDYYERHHHWEDPDYLNHGIKQTCNLWRNYIDVSDSWDSIEQIIQFWARTGPNDTMVRAAGMGGWNDPDMLVVGNPGLSLSEQQAQFAFWAIFAAPLMISADLYAMPEESRAILLNREVIAVNQDPLGRQGWYAGNLPGNGRVWHQMARQVKVVKNDLRPVRLILARNCDGIVIPTSGPNSLVSQNVVTLAMRIAVPTAFSTGSSRSYLTASKSRLAGNRLLPSPRILSLWFPLWSVWATSFGSLRFGSSFILSVAPLHPSFRQPEISPLVSSTTPLGSHITMVRRSARTAAVAPPPTTENGEDAAPKSREKSPKEKKTRKASPKKRTTASKETTASPTKKKAKVEPQRLTERDELPKLWSDEKAKAAGSYTFRIASWNVAGIRAMVKKEPTALVDLCRKHQLDVLCLQETKLQETHLDDPKMAFRGILEEAGYKDYWSCSVEKKGYSGTAVFIKHRDGKPTPKQADIKSFFGKPSKDDKSKGSSTATDVLPVDPKLLVPSDISYNIGGDIDKEGRTIIVEFPFATITNVYVPNAGQTLQRLEYRTKQWDKDFLAFQQKKEKERGLPVIWLGDLNIAHKAYDVWNDGAKHLDKQAGVTPQERASFQEQLDAGYVDAFRALHPEAKGHYSYWSQRAGNREPNKGLRLDYFVCSPELLNEDSEVVVRDSYMVPEQMGSDHSPVVLELEVK
eukprot:Nitzschia sp. Nitz4//scaffold88_size82704//3250//6228//NITZ4_005279-RA/size82704-processed-gene-0.62-mRNA-1//-1//CDS//3329559455//1959//frame0